MSVLVIFVSNNSGTNVAALREGVSYLSDQKLHYPFVGQQGILLQLKREYVVSAENVKVYLVSENAYLGEL